MFCIVHVHCDVLSEVNNVFIVLRTECSCVSIIPPDRSELGKLDNVSGVTIIPENVPSFQWDRTWKRSLSHMIEMSLLF